VYWGIIKYWFGNKVWRRSVIYREIILACMVIGRIAYFHIALKDIDNEKKRC